MLAHASSNNSITFMLGAFLHVQQITPRIDFQINEASQFFNFTIEK